jgi:hypothetical protein
VLTVCHAFTGRLIARYLEKHPERSKIKYAIAGRSVNKLNALASELKLDQSNVAIIGVNISDYDELEALVKRTRLVINCVGPFALYSTPVVRYVHATSWATAPLNFPYLQRMCADCNSLYGHHRRSTLDPQDDSRVFPNGRSSKYLFLTPLLDTTISQRRTRLSLFLHLEWTLFQGMWGALMPSHNPLFRCSKSDSKLPVTSRFIFLYELPSAHLGLQRPCPGVEQGVHMVGSPSGGTLATALSIMDGSIPRSRFIASQNHGL